MNWLIKFLFGAVPLISGLLLIWALMVGVRWFNNSATSISVSEARPGVYCALATSTDGVAISCWKEDAE